MKYLNFFLLCVFGITLCLMSCHKEDSCSATEDMPGTVPLSLHTNVMEGQTRNFTLKEEFVPGDKIGLFIVKDGTDEIYTTSPYERNKVPATYTDRYVWEQEVFLTDEKVNVYGFYPFDNVYHAGKFDIMFNITALQQYMYGTHAKGTLSYADRINSSVQLEMKNVLGIAEFFFRVAPEYPGAGNLTTIEIYNRDMPSGPIPSDISMNVLT